MWATCWKPEGEEIIDLSMGPPLNFFFLEEDEAAATADVLEDEEGLAAGREGHVRAGPRSCCFTAYTHSTLLWR